MQASLVPTEEAPVKTAPQSSVIQPQPVKAPKEIAKPPRTPEKFKGLSVYHDAKTELAHLCFLKYGNKEIHYGLWNGTTLRTQRVTTFLNNLSNCRVILGADRKPYVLFHDRKVNRLSLFAQTPQAPWSETPLNPPALPNKQWTSVLVDDAGALHALTYEHKDKSIHYAKHHDGQWLTSRVTAYPKRGGQSKLYLDAKGQPNVVLQHGKRLKLFSKHKGSWRRRLIPTPRLKSNQRMKLISVLANHKGEPHVHYHVHKVRNTARFQLDLGPKYFALFHASQKNNRWKVTKLSTVEGHKTKMVLTADDEPVVLGKTGYDMFFNSNNLFFHASWREVDGTWSKLKVKERAHVETKHTFLSKNKELLTYHVTNDHRLIQTRYAEDQVIEVEVKRAEER